MSLIGTLVVIALLGKCLVWLTQKLFFANKTSPIHIATLDKSVNDALSTKPSIRIVATKNNEAAYMSKALKSEFSNNKRFKNLLYNNLHFLAPLDNKTAKRVMDEASGTAMGGGRSGNLSALIQELAPGLDTLDIDEISRTAISKVQSAISQERSQGIGINWYVWRTCQDERVRHSHKKLEGVVCSYSNPPEPETLIGEESQGAYNPGESTTCRCYAETLLDLSGLRSPFKIILNGKLTMIGKRQFKKL